MVFDDLLSFIFIKDILKALIRILLTCDNYRHILPLTSAANSIIASEPGVNDNRVHFERYFIASLKGMY